MATNTFSLSTGWGPSGADSEVQSLQKINGILAGTAGVSIPVNTAGAGGQLTPSSSNVNSNGSVSAGLRHIEFILSSDFSGTINGATILGSSVQVYVMDAPAGFTLGGFNYTIAAGSAILTQY